MDNSERAVIPQRQLGTSGVFCEGMALGCYSMSNAYVTRSDSESIQVIRQAIDAGINVIDTADFYGWGHNEKLVATAVEDLRDRVLLSSKFGYVLAENGLGVRGDPDYVKNACEDSLPTISTYISSIASMPTYPSRTRSARWPISYGRARCGTSGSARCPKRR